MILTATQQTIATLVIEDSRGNPARVDGVPQWASSDPNIVSVTPDANGMSAVVASVGTGTAQISVTADADLGAGVLPLVGVADIEVVSGQATVVRLALAPPTEQA
jgi:hypothetical protein